MALYLPSTLRGRRGTVAFSSFALLQALEKTGVNRTHTARLLRITRGTLL